MLSLWRDDVPLPRHHFHLECGDLSPLLDVSETEQLLTAGIARDVGPTSDVHEFSKR
jgi:hypothetical protein